MTISFSVICAQSVYLHPVSTKSAQLNLLSVYTSALQFRGMSCITAVSHILYTCVVHLETVSVIVATKVYSTLFTHQCCLADFVWVVSVLHSGYVSLYCLCHAVQTTQVWSFPTPATGQWSVRSSWVGVLLTALWGLPPV